MQPTGGCHFRTCSVWPDTAVRIPQWFIVQWTSIRLKRSTGCIWHRKSLSLYGGCDTRLSRVCLLCLWGWCVGASERHDEPEQNKNFAELNEKLTWQLAGEVKGKKEILIPASAKEIYVEVGSDTSKLGTVTIPVIRLSEKDIKYNLYELYLNGQQYVRSIVVSKLRVIIGECKTAGKDASSSTVTTMYYR